VLSTLRILRRIDETSMTVRLCGAFALATLIGAAGWYVIEVFAAGRSGTLLPIATVGGAVVLGAWLLVPGRHAGADDAASSTCRAELSDVLPTSKNLTGPGLDSPKPFDAQ
jgi:hypothetical protein